MWARSGFRLMWVSSDFQPQDTWGVDSIFRTTGHLKAMKTESKGTTVKLDLILCEYFLIVSHHVCDLDKKVTSDRKGKRLRARSYRRFQSRKFLCDLRSPKQKSIAYRSGNKWGPQVPQWSKFARKTSPWECLCVSVCVCKCVSVKANATVIPRSTAQ